MDRDSWMTILEPAIENGHVSVMKELFEHYSDRASLSKYGNSLQTRGYSPLTMAVELGDIEMIRFLLAEASLDVNAKDKCGHASVHVASKLGNLAVLKKLLDVQDINIEIRSSRAYSHLAFDLDHLITLVCRDSDFPDFVIEEIPSYVLRIALQFVKDKDKDKASQE
jgi:ankyrin repeat protein